MKIYLVYYEKEKILFIGYPKRLHVFMDVPLSIYKELKSYCENELNKKMGYTILIFCKN